MPNTHDSVYVNTFLVSLPIMYLILSIFMNSRPDLWAYKCTDLIEFQLRVLRKLCRFVEWLNWLFIIGCITVVSHSQTTTFKITVRSLLRLLFLMHVNSSILEQFAAAISFKQVQARWLSLLSHVACNWNIYIAKCLHLQFKVKFNIDCSTCHPLLLPVSHLVYHQNSLAQNKESQMNTKIEQIIYDANENNMSLAFQLGLLSILSDPLIDCWETRPEYQWICICIIQKHINYFW